MVSSIPSKANPTSSNFALIVADPELPLVISNVEIKFTSSYATHTFLMRIYVCYFYGNNDHSPVARALIVWQASPEYPLKHAHFPSL